MVVCSPELGEEKEPHQLIHCSELHFLFPVELNQYESKEIKIWHFFICLIFINRLFFRERNLEEGRNVILLRICSFLFDLRRLNILILFVGLF